MEDSGLQITLWGPTIGNFENINLEILNLPSPKGSKTRVHGGGVAYIYIYTFACGKREVRFQTMLEGENRLVEFHGCFPRIPMPCEVGITSPSS